MYRKVLLNVSTVEEMLNILTLAPSLPKGIIISNGVNASFSISALSAFLALSWHEIYLYSPDTNITSLAPIFPYLATSEIVESLPDNSNFGGVSNAD